jgi:uncharacterized protein
MGKGLGKMIYKEADLKQLTKFELLDIAAEVDVKYRTRMSKSKLIESILLNSSSVNQEPKAKEESMLEMQRRFLEQDSESAKERELVQAAKYSQYTKEEKKNLNDSQVLDEQKLDYQSSQNIKSPEHDFFNDYTSVPQHYYDDKIVAMVVDPTHLHFYWETTAKRQQELLKEISEEGSSFDLVLRLYDITDINFNGQNAWSEQEITVGFSRNWYFVVAANRTYCAEIGMRLHSNGKFILIARSNTIKTPRDSVSDFYDEEWMMIDFNNNKNIYSDLYKLSGGYDMKKYILNSAFVTERIERPYDFKLPDVSLSSESLSSISLTSRMLVKQPKDFWLWVDTELIVYGQTKVDAKELTINGEKVKLDAEGRFRLHMALPNGNFPFHVRAVSKCGSMVEEVTPKVLRVMEKEKLRTKG